MPQARTPPRSFLPSAAAARYRSAPAVRPIHLSVSPTYGSSHNFSIFARLKVLHHVSGLDLLRVPGHTVPRETCHRPRRGRHRNEGRLWRGPRTASAAARGPPRHRTRARAPTRSSQAILDFAAELRAYGARALRRARRGRRRRRPRHRRRGAGHRRLRGEPRLARRTAARAAGRAARGVPVALGHDVRTGGLAEGRIGAGRGADRFLFVALGTGIAGAIGIDGRVEAGAHGFAGEIGHIVVRPGGRPCALRSARLPGDAAPRPRR